MRAHHSTYRTALMACGKTVAGLEITKGNTVAKNTGRGYRRGLIRGRFQKFNPISGLWDKYARHGNYLSSKKSGGPFKAIIRLIGRNPRRPR